MTILRSFAFIAALSIGFGGCTLYSSKPADNSPAKQREALEVPPDLTRPASDSLAAPAGEAATFSGYTAKIPAAKTGTASTGVLAAPAGKAVRLERDGAQRWLVVQGDPEGVWVKARDYFLREKTALSVDNAKTGVLETDWVDRPVKFTGILSGVLSSLHSTGLRDKFRIRVERGRVDGTAEVYVSHQALAQMVTNNDGSSSTQIFWQPSPADPEMEAVMIGKLLTHFGFDEEQVKSQLASSGVERAQLIKGALLLPQDDHDTAWRRVGQALDRAGVTTEDRDRNGGIFYVRYVDSSQAGKSKGLFSWLSSSPASASGTSDAGSETASDRFQVRLQTAEAGTRVSVLSVKGEPELSAAGQQLLAVLQQQLR